VCDAHHVKHDVKLATLRSADIFNFNVLAALCHYGLS